MEAVSAGGSCLFTTFAMVPAFTAKMDPSGPLLRITGKTLLSSRFILRKIWGQITKLIPFNSMYLFPHSEALSLVTGLKITSGRFIQIGERGFNLERLFNIREGLSGNDDTLPGRLTGVPIDKDNPHTIVKLKEMLPLYYRIRGWNSHGVPKAKKIRNLGIEVKDNGLWGGNVPTSPKEKHSHSSINYTR
jgi:aldehyde:ferredoxin oxidoreductase